MKPKYIVIIVLSIIAAGVVFWYMRMHQPNVMLFTPKAPAKEQALGVQIYEKQKNPVKDQIPATNPYNKPVNPLDDSYKNPFN